ncbi:MAG: ribosome maturation factor RimM [Bacillaceae bacterium]|nr:ribosome maturation factor RimM [Bacillaceae bacterium]
MLNYYNVGKVVNTHGIRGEIRVISTTDFPEERFAPGSILYLDHPTFSNKLTLTVATHRRHKNFNLVTFKGYDSLNEVEKFKGGILQVSEEQLGELEEGDYYYHEIIGCQVATIEGEDLGKIKEILSPGANDVWVIQRKNGGKDLLIPYIEQVVKEVNINEKKVTIHLMEGLE